MRQEANLTLDQENLTTQQDTVMPDEVKLNQEGNTFRWPQPTFDQVISRWYKIASSSWRYSDSQDATVYSVDLSKALFNIQTLFDKVKRFRYWRAGMKVRIQTNSTPFHYGSLFAAIVPYYDATAAIGNPVEASTWGLSGLKCSGYLSANTGKPLELTCPFQTPHEYLDITQQDDVRPFYLIVVVMNPLKVAGGATNPTLALTVFAKFEDLEIIAPSEITANSSTKKVVAADKEQRNATKQGTLGKVAGAVSDVAGSLSSVPVIGSIASAVAPISKAVGSIFDYFGWDKPTNISSQVFTAQRQARAMQNSSGQDIAESLGLKPDQKVSTEVAHFGLNDESSRSFLKLLQTPMWVGSFTIANNQVVENVFKSLWIRPYAPDITDDPVTSHIETQRHDYMSYYSQFFKACRGGYRYFICFDTSSYTTARVRMTFEPSNLPVTSITDGGDFFSRIVDIAGATCTAIEIPYCYPSARMPIAYTHTGSGPANGQLLFSLVNPIQTNGSSTDTIYVNIFRCPADDFRFYQLTPFTKKLQYGLELAKKKAPTTRVNQIKPNSLLELINSETVHTLGDGPKVIYDRVTEDEEIYTHNDYLHRYRFIQSTNTDATLLAVVAAGDPAAWMSPFRAYRGAQRFCVFADYNQVGISYKSVGSNFNDLNSNGGFFLKAGTTECPIELPYNNNIRFLPVGLAPSTYLDAYDKYVKFDGSAAVSVIWSAGDDFTLGLRKHPTIVSLPIP